MMDLNFIISELETQKKSLTMIRKDADKETLARADKCEKEIDKLLEKANKARDKGEKLKESVSIRLI